MALQKVSPAPDGPVAKEPQAGGDNGADAGEGIFSLLFLLSLMGKNGGQDPVRNVLQGEDAGMRPGNLGETSMSCKLTEEHENVIPAQAGIQNAGSDLDSHLRGNDGHSGDTREDAAAGLFTDQGRISIPGLHGLENQASPVVIDSGVVPAFLKESDCQNNPGANSDPQGECPWMGSASKVSVTMDPVSPLADTRLHSFQMHIEQENILQQLSARMARVRETGTHSARIRLHPDELGELSLDISVTNNSVRAFISVENYHVKEIIEANLNRLEAELKNQGLSIEQFTVETGGRGFREEDAPSHSRGDRAAQGAPGRITMDNGADQWYSMIPDFTGRGMVNIFV
ncbi:MAG TPA: flagellar hook-length control protein FliK [Nitrospirota bacterium]|nr:flagellar hook-length control protein FliK [Nitrospirota bacterium]